MPRLLTLIKKTQKKNILKKIFLFNSLYIGDSGGPIMREDNRTGRFVLLGLVSFGPRTCGVSSFPGVYSRTSSYLEWILNNMQL